MLPRKPITKSDGGAYIKIRTNYKYITMENLTSPANNIENTAQLIMDAFRHFNVPADGVLAYTDLLPYLDQHDEHKHFKDVQKEAEHHLTKEAYATPDAAGLRLTPVGYTALHEK